MYAGVYKVEFEPEIVLCAAPTNETGAELEFQTIKALGSINLI